MTKSYLTITILILIVIGGGYLYYSRIDSGLDLRQFGSANLGFLKSDSSRELPIGSRSYHSEQYKFSLFYPEGMLVNEFDEGGGASTITFEDAEEGLGFQIFIVPYGENQVSEERFLMDVPLGIRENSSDFYIDGAVAVSFYSKNIGLGDTWEVWFIREGFLYEVTTLKNLDVWFGDIMKSWKFIN